MREKTVIAMVLIMMFLVAPLDSHGTSNKEKVINKEILPSKSDLYSQKELNLLSRQPKLFYEEHERIEILNNSAFGPSEYNFTGYGNKTHPYIIENYNITDSSGTLIAIENTTMWFQIKDCYLNATGANYHCISLTNVTHGTVENNTICDTNDAGLNLFKSNNNTLTGNTIYNCSLDGISLDSSRNNTLAGNTIYYCSESGINLYSSNNNTLAGNTIYNCTYDGIYMQESSNNNTFSGNTIYNHLEGIYMEDSSNNTLSGNTFYNCYYWSIYMFSSSNNSLSGNTIYNTESGIEMHSSSNNNTLSGNTIYNCSIYGIHQDSSNYSRILGNSIYNCTPGIQLEGADHNTLLSNTIYNCSTYGIDVVQTSKNNTLFGNTIYECVGDGIRLFDYCTNNNITYNTIYNCSEHGINIYPAGNSILVKHNNTIYFNNIFNNTLFGLRLAYVDHCTIKWNNFVDNNPGGIQAYDNHETNTISNNYWNDYGGDGSTPYDLDGGSSSNDTSPSVTPVLPIIRVISPINQEYGSDTITVSLYGTPNIFLYRYYISGIDGTNQTWTTNVGRTLSDGTYTLHAYGIDRLGFTGHDSVTFTIDADLPTIVIDSPATTTYATGTITVDLSGIADHFWYNVAGVDSVNQTWTTAVQRSLMDGTYSLHAYSNDSAGNEAHASVSFTIDTIAPVVNITSPTNTTYDQNTVSLNYTVSDGIVTIYLNGTANDTAIPSGSTVTDIPDGVYNVTIIAVDEAGNIGKDTVICTIKTGKKKSDDGSFPGIVTVLLFLTIITAVYRRPREI